MENKAGFDRASLNKRLFADAMSVDHIKEDSKSGFFEDNIVDKNKKEISSLVSDFKKIPLNECFYAPKDWNIYSRLEGEDRFHTKESIRRNGILHNIIVWLAPSDFKRDEKDKNKKYMILGGRNRHQLLYELFDETQDTSYFNIPARVYALDEITPKKARELLNDSNLGRNKSDAEKAYSVLQQYKILEEQYPDEGKMKLYDRIAEDPNIEASSIATVRRHMNLGKLIPELDELYEVINVKQLSALGAFDVEKQMMIANLYRNPDTKELITTKNLKKLKKLMEKETILKVLTTESEKPNKEEAVQKVTLEVRAEAEKAVIKFYRQWIKDNGYA